VREKKQSMLTRFLSSSRYFKDDYVQSMFFLDTIALKDDYEKDQFFKRLQPLIQALPAEVSRFKVLPELVKGDWKSNLILKKNNFYAQKGLDYGTANFRVLGPILEIGEAMSEDEYKRLVGPSVVKWFASPDRSLRRNLLEHLPAIVR
jgi:SCY1-like protein 1